jgi:hypothetical protein
LRDRESQREISKRDRERYQRDIREREEKRRREKRRERTNGLIPFLSDPYHFVAGRFLASSSRLVRDVPGPCRHGIRAGQD